MPFGKRTRDDRQTAPGSPAAELLPSTFDDADRPGVPKWKLMLLAAAGSIAAVFTLFVFVIPALLKAGGPTALAAGESAPNVPGQVVIELPVENVPESLIKSNLELRKACIQNDDEVRKVPVMVEGQQLKWQINDLSSGRIYRSYSGSQDVLACLLTHEMPRYCDSGERKKMAELLTSYAKNLSELADKFKDVTESVTVAPGATSHQIASAGNDIDATQFSAELAISATMINALNLVSKSGYISANDFTGDVPDELAPFLAQSKAQPCN